MEQPPKEKSAWKRKLEELNEIGDSKGEGIDENIKETLAALQLLGIETSASCEGHIDWGISVPWVDLTAPNEPSERFVRENETYEEVAKKFESKVEDVKRAVNQEAWVEAQKRLSEQDETPEYKKWREEKNKTLSKVKDLLDEFYKDRAVSDSERIILDDDRLHNGGKDYQSRVEEKDFEKRRKDSELLQRLAAYQNEMRAFTEFLKSKLAENQK